MPGTNASVPFTVNSFATRSLVSTKTSKEDKFGWAFLLDNLRGFLKSSSEVMKRSNFHHFCAHEKVSHYSSLYHHKQSPSLQTFKIERRGWHSRCCLHWQWHCIEVQWALSRCPMGKVHGLALCSSEMSLRCGCKALSLISCAQPEGTPDGRNEGMASRADHL